MKKVVLVLFALFIGVNLYGQRRRSNNNIPQTQREPTERDIAKYKRDSEERKQLYIANFISTLEADDFQKEIIKQSINSYFDESMAIIKTKFDHRIDRDAAVKKLQDTHFKDLEELISESDMAKIKEMITGGFDEKEVVKKKKKKKKKKRNKDKN